MLKNKRILIIAPHADDEAICSGGLIMRAKEEGATVFVLYIAIGNSRQLITGETSIDERLPEITKASKLGNFEYKIIFKGDEHLKLDTIAQKTLIDVIEDATTEFKPDIVVIPNRTSFNQDHRAVGQACMTAFRPLPKDLHHQPEMILEMEEPYTWTEAFKPNLYINISDLFAHKIALYNCHSSQVPKDPFPRSIENLTRLAGMRGAEISCRYAEGYKLLKGIL